MISGPADGVEKPDCDAVPPGEFVSDDLRADCARFLDELRSQLGRREEPRHDDAWVPARREA